MTRRSSVNAPARSARSTANEAGALLTPTTICIGLTDSIQVSSINCAGIAARHASAALPLRSTSRFACRAISPTIRLIETSLSRNARRSHIRCVRRMDGSSGAALVASAGVAFTRAGAGSLPEPVAPLEFVDRFAMEVNRSSSVRVSKRVSCSLCDFGNS